MAYVQQVCDGYNKKALMGNWYEERLYPKQPFREEIIKAVDLLPFRPETKTKPSPASTTPASREHYPVSNEGANGKQPIGSSSTMDT